MTPLLIDSAVIARPVRLADTISVLIHRRVFSTVNTFISMRAITSDTLGVTASAILLLTAVVPLPILFTLAAMRRPDRVLNTVQTVSWSGASTTITLWVTLSSVVVHIAPISSVVQVTNTTSLFVKMGVVNTIRTVSIGWTRTLLTLAARVTLPAIPDESRAVITAVVAITGSKAVLVLMSMLYTLKAVICVGSSALILLTEGIAWAVVVPPVAAGALGGACASIEPVVARTVSIRIFLRIRYTFNTVLQILPGTAATAWVARLLIHATDIVEVALVSVPVLVTDTDTERSSVSILIAVHTVACCFACAAAVANGVALASVVSPEVVTAS
jgi:hypothetical protein